MRGTVRLTNRHSTASVSPSASAQSLGSDLSFGSVIVHFGTVIFAMAIRIPLLCYEIGLCEVLRCYPRCVHTGHIGAYLTRMGQFLTCQAIFIRDPAEHVPVWSRSQRCRPKCGPSSGPGPGNFTISVGILPRDIARLRVASFPSTHEICPEISQPNGTHYGSPLSLVWLVCDANPHGDQTGETASHCVRCRCSRLVGCAASPD